MRSRASQARALYRILSAQSASGSSAATATTSASVSTSAVTSQSTRSTAAFKKRRNIAASATEGGSKNENHRIVHIRASSPHSSSSSSSLSPAQSIIFGLQPVYPPMATKASVAMQAFFASGRPLLEHQVVSSTSSSGSSSSSSQSWSSSESNESVLDKVKTTIDNARDAIMEAASQASRLSPNELSRTTFVVTGMSEAGKDEVWPKKIANLNHDRFIKLVNRLSRSGAGLDAVQAEAKALEEEEAHKKDVESAIASALERGEDTSVAKSLGSEADLVVLGEPNGPNPRWPRGVASFLVEKTRALEPPSAPLGEGGEEDLIEAVENMDIEDLAKHFTGSENSFTVQNVREDDANLLLSHAMVQAILPSQLRWDSVIAKMQQATDINHSTAATQIVDWSAVNADWTPAENEDGDEVNMDSVKRKRRKKMKKHKYRKFRKATRVERNRLKK